MYHGLCRGVKNYVVADNHLIRARRQPKHDVPFGHTEEDVNASVPDGG